MTISAHRPDDNITIIGIASNGYDATKALIESSMRVEPPLDFKDRFPITFAITVLLDQPSECRIRQGMSGDWHVIIVLEKDEVAS